MTAFSSVLEEFKQEARSFDILEVARRLGAKLKRAGHEHVGLCPVGCCTHDGFQVNQKEGVFLCRPSQAGGDAIALVQHCVGCDFTEALEWIVGRDLPGKSQPSAEETESRRRRLEAQRKAVADRIAKEEREALARRRRDEEACLSILARSGPIRGTHAERYLRGRGVDAPAALTKDLLFVESVDYWGEVAGSDRKLCIASLPAMVAVIRDVAGAKMGIHITHLDRAEPVKWIDPAERRLDPKDRKNSAKKMRLMGATLQGGLIRFGAPGARFVVGEGIETVLCYREMCARFGMDAADWSFAAALSLNNLCGGATGWQPHPFLLNESGRPIPVPNGVPNPQKPGLILPGWVREVVILGDSDSERVATRRKVLAQVRRWTAFGISARAHFAPPGMDWADALAEIVKRETAGKVGPA